MSSEKDCLFCKIIRKEVDARVVFEDEHLLAFYDINPAATIHVLVIPKTHIHCMNDVTAGHKEFLSQMFLCVPKLAKELGVDQKGYRLVVNTKAQAGQTVFHIHMHFLAGREFSWPPG